MSAPVLSIITSTFNAMRFFPETAESVLRLDLDFEWLIADNASTDGTPAYIQELARRNARVRCRLNPVNLGSCGLNWTRSLPEASGKYILFLDADDVLPSGKALAAGIEALDRNPRVHVALSQVAYMDAESRVYKVKHVPFARYGSIMSGRQMFWTLFLSPTVPFKWGTVLARKTLYDTIGPVYDIHFLLAAAEHSGIALIDAVGLHYRNHPASNSSRPTIVGDPWWTELAHKHLPNRRYCGLKYVFIAYKRVVSYLKAIYRLFSHKRI